MDAGLEAVAGCGGLDGWRGLDGGLDGGGAGWRAWMARAGWWGGGDGGGLDGLDGGLRDGLLDEGWTDGGP